MSKNLSQATDGGGGRHRPERAPRVFASYAADDKPYWLQLERHLTPLKNQNYIKIWHRQCLKLDDEPGHEIPERIRQADTIMVLLSAYFFADEDCQYEISKMNELATAALVLVLVRPVDLTDTQFDVEQVWPPSRIPISQRGAPPHDEAWHEFAQHLRQRLFLGRQLEAPDTTGWPEHIPARSLDRHQIWLLKRNSQKNIINNAQIYQIALQCGITLSEQEKAPDILWNSLFTQAYNMNRDIKPVLQYLLSYQADYVQSLIDEHKQGNILK